MDDKLDFSLPENSQNVPAGKGSGRGLLYLLLIGQIALLVLLFLARTEGEGKSSSAELDLESQRKLALKLERQGLADAAADAWQNYLSLKDADPEKAAKIWYRIGKTYQESENFAKAVEAYYRSESFMQISSLTSEIGRRTQECLEALGKFAALRYELADRVDVGSQAGEAGEEVVAEIGPMKVTRSDLDKQIEQAVARRLQQAASYLPPDQLRQQQETLLKRFSSSQHRLQLLNQFLMQEVLVRKAREDGTAEQPAVRQTLRDAERDILAQQFLQGELTAKINITPGDVETFYTARKETFMEPEAVRIAHILVPTEEKAEAVLNSLKTQDFAELAQQVSTDEATAEKGGLIDAWLEAKQSYLPGLSEAGAEATAKLLKLAFATAPDTVAEEAVKTAKGFHIIKTLERREARQKPLDEVRQEAAAQLKTQKEQEVQEALFRQLFEKYGVVIHNAQFGQQDDNPDKDGN